MIDELALKQFIADLNAKRNEAHEPALIHLIRNRMELLISDFIRKELEYSSDIKYNADLAKSLIAEADFADLARENADEYTIRRHMREILRAYVRDTQIARPIHVTDKTRFGFQMESLGLNIGFSAGQSLIPDGNVLVLSVTLVAVLALALLFHPH